MFASSWTSGIFESRSRRLSAGKSVILEISPALQNICRVMFSCRQCFQLRRSRFRIGGPHLPVQCAGLSVDAGERDFRRRRSQKSTSRTEHGVQLFLESIRWYLWAGHSGACSASRVVPEPSLPWRRACADSLIMEAKRVSIWNFFCRPAMGVLTRGSILIVSGAVEVLPSTVSRTV